MGLPIPSYFGVTSFLGYIWGTLAVICRLRSILQRIENNLRPVYESQCLPDIFFGPLKLDIGWHRMVRSTLVKILKKGQSQARCNYCGHKGVKNAFPLKNTRSNYFRTKLGKKLAKSLRIGAD